LSSRLAQAPTRLRAIPAGALVLGDRPLRPGVVRAATSRFHDMVWDLSPAILHKHGRKLILDFARVPERFRLAAKELCYALLAGEPLPGQPQLRVESIRKRFSTLLGFLTWAEARGVSSLADLTASDLAAYQAHLLKQQGKSAEWRRERRRCVRLFWVYRGRLSTDRLALDPDRLAAWEDESSHAGRDRGENRTERIPEAVLGPLLGWALRWVDEFADDVVRAQVEWLPLYANTGPNRARRDAPRMPWGEVWERLELLLDRYRTERRPLPQRGNGLVNLAHLARELDCGYRTLWEKRQARALIEEAARDVGLADGTWLRTQIRGQLSGRPWRTAIAYEEVPELARHLQTACYIVIAYLSGMRDSEVKHLRRGCLTARRDDTGRVYRWTVTSQAFKGEQRPEGVEATWVVGEPVGRAVAVLEQLQPPGQDLLFAHLPGSRYFHRERANQARTSSQTLADLAAFVDWVDAACDTHGLPDRVPLVAGQRWRLTTSQFRRILSA
jgi:integrase